MEIKNIQIEFKKDDLNNEFATVTVNDNYVINSRGKLDLNKCNIGKIYAKVDKSGNEITILSRISSLIGLLKDDKIEYEI